MLAICNQSAVSWEVHLALLSICNHMNTDAFAFSMHSNVSKVCQQANITATRACKQQQLASTVSASSPGSNIGQIVR